jgi:hypothetical protein
MKWTIDKRSMPSYVRIETSGEASPEDFAAMWDKILQSDFWRPGLTVLLDNQKRKPLKDPDGFTCAAIEYFEQNADRIGNACISTISSQPEYFKYARQFQYGLRLKGSHVVLQMFTSESQAVKWLDYYSARQINDNKTAAVR